MTKNTIPSDMELVVRGEKIIFKPEKMLMSKDIAEEVKTLPKYLHDVGICIAEYRHYKRDLIRERDNSSTYEIKLNACIMTIEKLKSLKKALLVKADLLKMAGKPEIIKERNEGTISGF